MGKRIFSLGGGGDAESYIFSFVLAYAQLSYTITYKI